MAKVSEGGDGEGGSEGGDGEGGSEGDDGEGGSEGGGQREFFALTGLSLC